MSDRQVALGMYSISEPLFRAWRSLFNKAGELCPQIGLPEEFVNSISEEVICSTKTCISHICGLPLIEGFETKFTPLCAPQFNIPGISGPQYFSHYVVRHDSVMRSVVDAKGRAFAANSLCSNSGLNVMRHEINTICSGSIENFFSKIHYTGSHHLSVRSVLEGVSEFAAIDAATYEYLCVINPDYRTQLRIIGRSRQFSAPPLVTHTNNPFCNSQLLTDALNSALNSLDQATRNTLNVRQFHKVKLGDYDSQIFN